MKKIFLFIVISLIAISCSDSNSKKERKALDFLYASMPQCDAVDYAEDYFLQNIEASFKAKEELPWGNSVPEREFKHFVLPIRVNNENLDDFRTFYYDELRDRVKDLSMYDAVLEVNHWCHEKVNYKGSDSRTSAPMATIKTSWGRCGEESTLLVAALRTVCIPARQVYVPRWAHCDDNHAWVEAWVDGRWHFLGACEPEPVLDLGWFNAPASRALLVHTRVFGDYNGPEEVIDRNANYTEINVVENYAATAKLNVKVVDAEGKAVKGARVDFKIYNYSEYNTVATKYTDNHGDTWLTAGLGTMMVYASKNGKFGYEVLKIGSTDNIRITLCRDDVYIVSTDIESYDYDIIPPVENARIPNVSAEMRAENNRRAAYEDSIRNAYVAKCVAAQNEGDYNHEIMAKSWGNYQTIKNFVDYARESGREEEAYKILGVISDKDLRDVTMDVLIDCVETFPETSQNDDFYYKYIVNPRVSNEMLRPYRAEFNKFVETFPETSLTTPSDIIKFVRDSIEISNDLNVRQIPMSPDGVMRSRVTDSHSRDIFFVALARAAGHPSRIDPVTGKVQYYDNQWIDVDFAPVETFPETSQKPGTLVIDYQGTDDPRYYTHFSIKEFNGNTFDLLAYDTMDPGMDVGMTLSQMMAEGGITLDPGYYVMSSGPRLDDGSVLNHLVFFTIESGKKTNVELIMREPIVETFPETSQNETSNLRIVAYLDSGSEPTTHAMQEFSILKSDFEKWGGSIEFVFRGESDFNNFKSKKFNELPDNIVMKIDGGVESVNLPLFTIVDENDEIVYSSQGYKIGLGEQMRNILMH
ncbi:MAG: transglutaminase domain-containing protein [Bacteroidales bacterium]|nr:transglutaminase domain-containing protein [Bacteroidales bacterium]